MDREPVLVTGASGFIGGRLVRRLIERQCQVSCLVRPSSRIDELRAAGVQLITGDVNDKNSLEQALVQSQAKTVYHLAGLVKAMRWKDFTRVNVEGVENMAAACATSSSPPILLIVSSLAAAGPCAVDELRVEGDVSNPVSHYGRSKLAGEVAAAKYAHALPISIVRPPIVLGPGDRGGLEIFQPIARWGVHVVPGLRRAASGDGDGRFTLVHVDDLVEGLLLAAEKGERLRPQGSPGEGVYFIGGDENPTYAELGQAIAKAMGRKPPGILRVPGPLLRLAGMGGDALAWVRRRAGWISSDKVSEALAGSWICSSMKARAQLGWSPAATLADRLQQTARWYRQAGWL